ncbi:tRNA (adenosine(37)-N6)-threonylcarbamoyltransferase complex transferase subunit TsaD [Corynebacterium sp. S7]
MIVLGIESSCDETGVGVIQLHNDGAMEILADSVASSMQEHARFGGVVPEIASRAHLEAMPQVMADALAQAGIDKPDAVAATVGPGLAGPLLVGASAAKAYAAAWGVPFYGVNHLGGHVAVANLDGAEELPHSIALLVSGGHTQLLEVEAVGKPMKELGSTLDDAAGEAYDKVSRLLGLGYPGGPIVDKLAQRGNPKAIAFPRGLNRPQDLRGEHRHDFSFSGLKTSVARYVERAEREGEVISLEDVCASFQEAVADVLTQKAIRACQDTGATTLLLGGGVAANSRLRSLAGERCDEAGIELRVPRFNLCTDNGVMIAALGAQLIHEGAPESGYGVGTDTSLEAEVPLVLEGR